MRVKKEPCGEPSLGFRHRTPQREVGRGLFVAFAFEIYYRLGTPGLEFGARASSCRVKGVLAWGLR